MHTDHLGFLLRCKLEREQVWVGPENLHFSDPRVMPKLLVQGPHCEGKSHTARKAAPICPGRAKDQDSEISSKEGVRTKLTRGLRRVKPPGTTEAQLSCRQ